MLVVGAPFYDWSIKMDFQNTSPVMAVPVAQQTAPPPSQPDGRASADVAATVKDPHPEVPLPMPASPSQTGLVSKASISEEPETPPFGTSEIQRTLKPYGISMLPERHDAPKQDPPPEA